MTPKLQARVSGLTVKMHSADYVHDPVAWQEFIDACQVAGVEFDDLLPVHQAFITTLEGYRIPNQTFKHGTPDAAQLRADNPNNGDSHGHRSKSSPQAK